MMTEQRTTNSASMKLLNLRRLSAIALAGLSTSAVVAAGQEGPVLDFDIPAQPVESALIEFSKQANLQVMLRPITSGGQLTDDLKGHWSVARALDHLLRGTDLTYERIGTTVTVVTTEVRARDQAGTEKQMPSPISGAGASEISQPEAPRKALPTATSEFAVDEVVVTGTRLRGARAPVGAPIVTLDRVEIDRRGYTTTEEVVQSIQQNFRGGAAGAIADSNFSSGTNSGSNTSYGSGVNIRGLGATATLVLVNGHRVASSGGGGFTDISTIPVSAIERIDVLTDGASAIYGSDAIGGVINIVLKKRSDGIEVAARAGTAAPDGYSMLGATLQFGDEWTTWDGGSYTVGVDFSRQTSLDANERSFTADVPSPMSVFPSFDQLAITAAAQQEIGSRLAIHADAQYADVDKTAFLTVPPPVEQTFKNLPRVKRWSGSVGATLDITDSFEARYDFSAGRESTNFESYVLAAGQPDLFQSDLLTRSHFTDHSLGFSGNLFALSAGAVRFAIGGSYRTEEFLLRDVTEVETSSSTVDRSITAAYAEMSVPIVGESNALPGLKSLTFSAAVRYDDYSDFGDTTNPKYGISWYPVESLQVRGAYSTSFRAPATGTELDQSRTGLSAGVVRPFPGVGGGPSVPVLFIVGGQPNLQPETAESITLGLDYKPPQVPGLSLSFNYYEIDYEKQLSRPPFSFDPLNDPALAPVITQFPDSAAIVALVNDAIANGRPIVDITRGQFGPNPIQSTVFLYDSRTANLSQTYTTGYDVSARYTRIFGLSTVTFQLEGAYIDEFVTAISSNAPEVDQVNSVGYPARQRYRAQVSWQRNGLDLTVAGNFVNSYPDSSSATGRHVDAYTTVDVVARYDFSAATVPLLGGVRAQLAVANAFNQSPPFVEVGSAGGKASGFHYDPANADPGGRFLSLTLSKQWK